MAGDRHDETTRALRALAHPLTVASLVLLALNDHVLKQAWPGWVTGKLSDVVGLVVAPLLLAVPLALLGLRRPAVVAVLATGLGFALVKTTGTGSDLASDLWSAVGWPSYLRRDPTDLLALPALLLALRVHRLAADPTTQLRRRATATVGAMVLPFAVLATAATSACDDLSTSRGLTVLEGRWEAGDGWERGARIVYGEEYVLEPAAGGLEARLLSDAERARVISWGDDHNQAVCDPARTRLCWRTYDPTRTVGGPDGGRCGGRVRVAGRRAHLVGGEWCWTRTRSGRCATRRGRCAGNRWPSARVASRCSRPTPDRRSWCRSAGSASPSGRRPERGPGSPPTSSSDSAAPAPPSRSPATA